MPQKRVLVIADLHCGHRVGLTPPKYQTQILGDRFYQIQVELWTEYVKIINRLRPIDILIVNGDCTDGKGVRSGGTELIVADLNRQCDMAIECIKFVAAPKNIMTFGTTYHIGEDETETVIARELKADIFSHAFVEINSLIFDIKHDPGGHSQLPHTKGTAIAREKLQNIIWSQHEEQPDSDIVIRSHVHNHFYCGDPYWLGMTTPALQGQGSKYGSRKCSGIIHWGMVHFDVQENGEYGWQCHTIIAESQKIEPIHL